jgi:RNA polymerase sigma factor (TIGR02999 family)
MGDVTLLLEAARHGKVDAVDRLYALLYRELRAIAHRQLRRQDHYHALDTTLVVHESYLRLRDRGALKPRDRAQFLAYSASAMRSVIIDMARSRLAQKRGSTQVVALRTNIAESNSGTDEQLVRIHDALNELAAIDPRLAQIVEMRFFAGMTEQEVAEALGISRRTAQRDWENARLFLFSSLQEN